MADASLVPHRVCPRTCSSSTTTSERAAGSSAWTRAFSSTATTRMQPHARSSSMWAQGSRLSLGAGEGPRWRARGCQGPGSRMQTQVTWVRSLPRGRKSGSTAGAVCRARGLHGGRLCQGPRTRVPRAKAVCLLFYSEVELTCRCSFGVSLSTAVRWWEPPSGRVRV